jgi:hypothetical protein
MESQGSESNGSRNSVNLKIKPRSNNKKSYSKLGADPSVRAV